MTRILAALTVAASALQPADPSAAFDTLYSRIRDQQIDRASALAQVGTLLPRIRDDYYGRGGVDTPPDAERFPLEGYGPESIGGRNGSGYQPSGYDWFLGRNSAGHPGHDLFIHDRDHDSLDDVTGKPVRVLSMTAGVVVAYSPDWSPASGLRGGRYVYVYSPAQRGIFYYAHNASILVKPGDIVAAGQAIATVGRTGRNAAMPRSPTHLHVMFLAVGDDGYPRPRDIYAELTHAVRSRPSGRR
jgi:hypothetical protein